MKVRVLGCSGAIAKDCRTTSFLIDSDLLVDAGTGVGDLHLEEMRRIDHVLLTHGHLDHVAALPLMVDAIASQRTHALKIYALAGTIAALKTHIFNNIIWPDFSCIPSRQAPLISFHPIEIGQTLTLGGKEIEVLPAIHTVPAVGYAVTTNKKYWVFTGDTEHNPALWARLNALNVAMLVIETAFSDREKNLAKSSLHFSPTALSEELKHIAADKSYPIYITHTKPAETAQIMQEIQTFISLSKSDDGHARDIEWLSAGQEFEL